MCPDLLSMGLKVQKRISLGDLCSFCKGLWIYVNAGADSWCFNYLPVASSHDVCIPKKLGDISLRCRRL